MTTMLTKQTLTRVLKLGLALALLTVGLAARPAQAQTELPTLLGHSLHLNYLCYWCNVDLTDSDVLRIDTAMKSPGVYRGHLDSAPGVPMLITIAPGMSAPGSPSAYSLTIRPVSDPVGLSKNFAGALLYQADVNCFYVAGTFQHHWRACSDPLCAQAWYGPYPFNGRSDP